MNQQPQGNRNRVPQDTQNRQAPPNGTAQRIRPQDPSQAMPRGEQAVAQSMAARQKEEEELRRRDEARRKWLAEQRKERERKQAKKRRFTAGLIAVIALYVLIIGIIALIVVAKISAAKKMPQYTYTYQYGDTVRNVSYADAHMANGELAVNFSEVARFCGMTTTGDSTEMRYISQENEAQQVRFRIGTRIVYVNGVEARLSDACRKSGSDLYVPVSFLENDMRGLTVEKDETVHAVAIRRNEIPTGLSDEISYAPIAFSLQSDGPASGILENDISGLPDPPDTTAPPDTSTPADTTKPADTTAPADTTIPADTTTDTPVTVPRQPNESGFLADLSAYEQYMDPGTDDYLILVNNEHTLDANYAPTDLIDVVNTRKDGRSVQRMRECAEKALEAFLLELSANGYGTPGPSGYPVSVTSAYRTYSYQKYLFDTYTQNEMARNPSLTKEQAEEITATYSARPGTSEHQTGLCVDMHNLAGADQSFANQAAAKWMAQNAHRFGFILRFPADKEDITNISYEPWHFRFVGREHATYIYEHGLCLEEYVANR